VKRGEVPRDTYLGVEDTNLKIMKEGRGIIGAIAAIPFYTRYEEALSLCPGKNTG
jgi:tRNA(Ile2) C34 agmatinyltransferase TiaS